MIYNQLDEKSRLLFIEELLDVMLKASPSVMQLQASTLPGTSKHQAFRWLPNL
jgi:hypothetical protein